MMKILLLGDSLFEYFDWQGALPGVSVVNRGIAGETVSGLLCRLADEVAATEMPDRVMIMVGTNNLAMDDYGFLGEYEKIVDFLIQTWPATSVTLTSLLPFRLPWLAPDAVSRLNDSLLRIAERSRVDYLDVYGSFIRGSEAGKAVFQDDGIHLTEEGYGLWVEVMKKYLFGSV